jgi:hypothetical protein
MNAANKQVIVLEAYQSNKIKDTRDVTDSLCPGVARQFGVINTQGVIGTMA